MCTSRCYGNKTPSYIVGLSKKSLFECTLLLISIPVTACARTTNVTCHSTIIGASEISVQVRAQAVCYGNKTPSYIVGLSKKFLFGWILLLISIPVTACARTINVKYHSTVNGVSEISVQVRAQAVAMATKHPHISLVCRKNPTWMDTPPDFDPCDGLYTHNQYHMSLHTQWSIGKQRSSTCTSRRYGNKTPSYIVDCRKNPCLDAHSS